MSKNSDGIISITPSETPLNCYEMPGDELEMEHFYGSPLQSDGIFNSKKFYRQNGAIYLINCVRFKEEQTLYLKSNIYGYPMQAQLTLTKSGNLN
jgi:CMP-N-acetylneuraminic acid synthetase